MAKEETYIVPARHKTNGRNANLEFKAYSANQALFYFGLNKKHWERIDNIRKK